MIEDEDDLEDKRASTGIAGLDAVLGGGFPVHHLHLVEGMPGTGKTTLALRFLFAGSEQGERGLYITLSESARELRITARRHGWSRGEIEIREVITSEESREQSVMYHPSEVELRKQCAVSSMRSKRRNRFALW